MNNQESGLEKNESPEALIARADSFESLYEAIKHIGPIQGSDGVEYKPEEIILTIEGLKSGQVSFVSFITRKYGLRDKVRELLKSYLDWNG